MSHTFIVTAIAGHCEVTTFGDLGPTYIEVTASAENALGERIELRFPINNQPRVGDTIEVDDPTVISKPYP